MKVIDVSKWQGAINWPAAKKDGVERVFIKATEAQSVIDAFLKTNAQGAAAAGIKPGYYHFARFKNSTEALAEAKYFVNAVAGLPKGPMALDLEANAGGLNKAELTAAANVFIQYLKAKGFKAVIYTSLNYYNNYLDCSQIDAALWLARYTTASSPGVNCALWQYTDSGKVAGISGNVDMNKLYVDIWADPKSGWLQENGSWYFYINGIKKTGWLQDKGLWYLLDNSGKMLTGWQLVAGSWYYLQDNGAMKIGWLQDNGAWYYLAPNGAMKTGWLQDQNKWYYLQPNSPGSGKMVTGFKGLGGKFYYFHDNGAMAASEAIELEVKTNGSKISLDFGPDGALK